MTALPTILHYQAGGGLPANLAAYMVRRMHQVPEIIWVDSQPEGSSVSF
jgi:hypothetical protein